ncbi:MAG: hypothetical protein AB7G35_15075 [Hyphomicrobiaceae bacterium]
MKKREQLPSIRYETFIEAFEKAVHACQQQVKKLESNQLEYIACVEAIRKVALPNDGKLTLTTTGATISITAMPTDSRKTFDAIAAAVGEQLVERKLRGSPEPAVSTRSTWYPDLRYVFYTTRRDSSAGHVGIEVRIPDEGIADVAVLKREETATETIYDLIERPCGGMPGREWLASEGE